VNQAPTLEQQIEFQIRTSGPMSVATYMGLCLTHPSKGYYKNQDPFGANGDFITAPEISQMFGELIGFWVVNLWQQMNEPKTFTLLELGPGRGTLMSDVLRVCCRAPGFRDALDLRLFETSPTLVAEQKARLEPYEPKWLENFENAGSGPIIILANEFFDALPIRQFVRKENGWHERQIGLDGDKRVFGLSPTPIPPMSMPPGVADAQIDEILEFSFGGAQLMSRLSQLVSRQGGAMLAIDYGYARTQTGETLQGVRRHAYTDVLEAPGEVDLSAHVDFEALASVARQSGLAVQPLQTQAGFLTDMGIAHRAAALARANPNLAQDIRAAEQRLIGPDQMGELFKVLCAHSPGLQPTGFGA
jgi:NADH dehydrogenase [ubiquinone] 1 alpha subcomplex assembly factor 7